MQKKFPWQILLDWFDKNGKHDFPWRNYNILNSIRHPDEGRIQEIIETLDSSLYSEGRNQGIQQQLIYHVWLAEILLQQTQADRVVGFYTKMLEKYQTIQDLSRATYEEFFPYYRGLGYYSRARNLLKTAKIITDEYGGIFPKDKSLLKKLPGVGEYTARAILAFGYTEPILAWDTNLETIFSRYYKGDKQIKLTEGEKDEIEGDFREFVTNKNLVRNINNALMDWARLMEPKNSNLLNRETYIFKESEFYISRGETEIIEKKITQYFPIPDATVIVILHQDHKVYYSLGEDIYSPFILPPSEDRDTRKYVQDYFRNTHKLELSVRPVHRKWITEDGKPYITVNAQIQAGNHIFHSHGKYEAKIIISQLYSK